MPFPILAALITGAMTGGKIGFDLMGKNDAQNAVEDRKVADLNQWESHLAEVKATYFAGPATREAQASALAEVDAGLAWLAGPQFALNPSLRADWRRQGYEDRIRGGKYDWFRDIRDPIANDERLSNPVTAAVGQAQQALGLSMKWMLALVAIVAAFLYKRFKP